MDKQTWTREQEHLLIGWAEKSSGYAWMHSKCVHYYKRRNWCISVPAAIFGYLAGATTLLSNDVFDNMFIRGSVGFSAILGGIFSNFQQMFTFKELTEQHRLSTLRFLAFFRDISCELSMHPDHRTNPLDYINMKRMELDKMLEQSPSIPDKVVREFNKGSKYMSLHKPEVANILQTIIPYGVEKITLQQRDKYRKKIDKSEKNEIRKYFKVWKKYYYIKTKKTIQKPRRTQDTDILQLEVANSVSHMGSQCGSDFHDVDINIDDDNEKENDNGERKFFGKSNVKPLFHSDSITDYNKKQNINHKKLSFLNVVSKLNTENATNTNTNTNQFNEESESTYSSDELRSPSFLSRESALKNNLKISVNPLSSHPS